MNKFFTLCFLFLFSISINAQDVAPCGTFDYRSKWLIDYQANPGAYNTKDDEILYIPLTVHLVGTDNGTGYYSISRLLDALCTLNEDFVETEMVFFIEGDINYINNSAWNNHETVLEGAEMMFANNVENTINCYFVADPAGNCGYNLPYAGMAVRKSCAGPNDHTWAHEMGHQLSLPHPFLGWEGGISYDGSVSPNFSSPAPDTVLYDYTYFQEIQYTDTLIVDTAVVEKVDGSNCTYAADGFCDTAPDYLAERWNCNGEGLSSTIQHDPNNEAFQSDGSLIMSYANDACSHRFSEEQQAAMRANVIDEKPELLYNQTPGAAPGTVVLNSPINGEISDAESTILDWEDTANTIGYYVRLQILLGNSTINAGTFLTTESELALDFLANGSTYIWSVRPYNNYFTCDDLTVEGEFVVGEVSQVEEISGLSSFSVIPNILAKGSSDITLEFDLLKSKQMQWKLINAAGQEIQNGKFEGRTGTNTKKMKISNSLNTGVYFIGLSDDTNVVFKKIIVE